MTTDRRKQAVSDIQTHGLQLPISDPWWVGVIGWLLFAVMAVYFAVHTLPAAWKTLNTDFPNYYLTARLAKEDVNTSRIYEWIWLARQKDHRQIDQPIVGLGAITPFSTLAVWPLASMSPLTAKHCWLILNLALVAAIVVLLRSLTQQPWRNLLLVAVFSVPLNRNFLYGQYYVLLLFLLTLACWCFLRQKRFTSGVLIGLAAGLKLFPLLYLVYFLRKKDFKAFTGGLVGCAGAAAASIAVFGWQANRVLFNQVLPWALRGEGLNPYDILSGSVTTLLHRLFIYEPQLNPTPTIHAAWMFAVVFPLIQTLLFAPALLLAAPDSANPEQIKLEWSAILLASLAISTAPASYHFTLLILPICLMWGIVRQRDGLTATAALLFLYVAIGYSGWKTIGAASGLTLVSVPRFYVVVALCLFTYWIMAMRNPRTAPARDTLLWAGGFVLLMFINIASGLRHQSGLYADYRWRLPTDHRMFQANRPVIQSDSILFTAMLPTGYHTVTQDDDGIRFDTSAVDQLAVTANPTERWTEEVGSESAIVSSVPGRESIHNAELPIASPDGRWLAYLREEHGRASLWIRAIDQPNSQDRKLTPVELDVLEMSFLPNGSLIFSAEPGGKAPVLFLVDQTGSISLLGPEENRYPAVSPDGHWLAYSKLQSGNWHLWLRDLHNGQTSRLTESDCNNVGSTWAKDSKTLVYASDCGRALWFTALCQRRVIE